MSFQEYESEEQEYADLVADNAIASWSDLDLKQNQHGTWILGQIFDLDVLGLKKFTVEPLDIDYSENNKEIKTDEFGSDLTPILLSADLNSMTEKFVPTYRWKLSDLEKVEKNGLKVFSCFALWWRFNHGL